MTQSYWQRRRIVGGLTVLAAALSVAACSSSKSSSGGSAASSGSGESGTANKSPIKIFAYADVTNPPPNPPLTFLQDIPTAVVKAINSAGGINGHPIDMTFCDSKFDPNATLACVKRATSGDYAAVIVPASNAGVAGADAILAKSNIPTFFAIASPNETTASNAVCPISTIQESGLGVGNIAKHLGLSKLGTAYVNFPIFAQAAKYVQAGLSRGGVQAGGNSAAPPTTTDFASTFAQAMSGGTDGIWYANSGPTVPATIKQFLQTYPKAPLVAQYLAPNTLKEVGSSASGRVFFPGFTQPISSGVPGAKQFVQDMQKYASDPSSVISSTYIPFALPVRLFAGIASTVKGNLTASTLRAALKTASNVSLGGLVPNYNGSKLGKVGAPCLYQATIVPEVAKNGDLTTVYPGGKFLDTKSDQIVAG